MMTTVSCPFSPMLLLTTATALISSMKTLFGEVNHQSHRECKRIGGLQETVNATAKQSERLDWSWMRQTAAEHGLWAPRGKITSQIRPDKQTLTWSATWPREVQRVNDTHESDLTHVR